MLYEYQIFVCTFEKISCKFEPQARLVTVLHRSMTQSQSYIHCGLHLQLPQQKKSSVYAHICLCLLMVLDSEAENLTILNFHRMRKVMDGSLLFHKVAFGPRMVVEGQRHFTKRGLP